MGHIGSESNEASLHTIFMSFELLRGEDNEELPTLSIDSLKDSYEDLIVNNNEEI
jgi:hypothetical protein